MTNLYFSERVSRIVQSEIRAMSIECEKVNGINLSQGVCDLETPVPVRDGAKSAIDSGVNHYTRYDGLPAIRQSISRKMKQFNKINCDPEKNVIVSGGATGAFYSTCLALLNEGDEVIVFEPYYGYHINTLLAAGAVPVYVKLYPPDWSFKPEELKKAVTGRTRAVLVNTPTNPSGKVFTAGELGIIADFCIENDLFIFTDEIYEYFVYDNGVHVSPGSIERISDRTITISGYSKTFCITGWRIGYAVCHEKWSKMIGYVNDLIYVCGPAPLQMGVSKGIDELKEDYYNNLCREYFKKREKFCGTLKSIGLRPYVPQGAYYVLTDVSGVSGKTSKEKAMHILNNTGVASVPGSAFYHDGAGENLVRFCFAKNDTELDEACRRLKRLT